MLVGLVDAKFRLLLANPLRKRGIKQNPWLKNRGVSLVMGNP